MIDHVLGYVWKQGSKGETYDDRTACMHGCRNDCMFVMSWHAALKDVWGSMPAVCLTLALARLSLNTINFVSISSHNVVLGQPEVLVETNETIDFGDIVCQYNPLNPCEAPEYFRNILRSRSKPMILAQLSANMTFGFHVNLPQAPQGLQGPLSETTKFVETVFENELWPSCECSPVLPIVPRDLPRSKKLTTRLPTSPQAPLKTSPKALHQSFHKPSIRSPISPNKLKQASRWPQRSPRASQGPPKVALVIHHWSRYNDPPNSLSASH